MRTVTLPAIAICTLLAAPAAAGDALRGRALYEGGCTGCHAESVHGRAQRQAADFESVRRWVRRWSDNLGLKWNEDEVSDVAIHLNERYYRFACPPADCKASGSREGNASRLALRALPR